MSVAHPTAAECRKAMRRLKLEIAACIAPSLTLNLARAEYARHAEHLYYSSDHLIVGIDPAMTLSGFAYGRSNGYRKAGVVDGIESLGAHDAILQMLVASEQSPARVLIEYPTWKGHGAEQVRAAANVWAKVLKAHLPKGTLFMRVRPQSWMGYLLPGAGRTGSGKPSDLYIPKARELWGPGDEYNGGPDYGDPNVSAAICLFEIADRIAWHDEWGGNPTVEELRRMDVWGCPL